MNAVTLARGALVCAGTAGIVAVTVLKLTLPVTDGAYGAPFLAFVLNPGVLGVWLLLVAGFGFLGFVDSLWSLKGADLHRAIPITIVVTALAAGAVAAKLAPLSAPAGLVVGMGAMRGCRLLFPLQARNGQVGHG
jgi:hypothetical protein